MVLTNTRYLKSIKAPKIGLLKPGSNNKKLGFKITKGRWKDKRLFSLTLTERATCPPSCHHWEDCYGNNMPFAHRFDHTSPEFLEAIETDIDTLTQKYMAGITVRLHVLGDFYSEAYVKFWDLMLLVYPTLTVFGYTANGPETEIGSAIRTMNLRYSERCVIRFSRNEEFSPAFKDRSAAEESFDGESFDCPEQTGKVKSCADCALCWTTDKTVRFLSH
jgi:hypothetical protein